MPKSLLKLMPVPETPTDTDADSIRKNEEELGISFPDDFKEYSRSYGTGQLVVGHRDDIVFSFEIYSAAFPGFVRLKDEFFQTHDEYRRAMGIENPDLGLFPEPGGLLPFAFNSNGVYWTWKTVGTPNEWKVCYIHTYDEGGYQVFDVGFTDFLAGFIEGSIRLEGFEFSAYGHQEFTPKTIRRWDH